MIWIRYMEFIDAYVRGKSINLDELVCRLISKAYRRTLHVYASLAEKNNIVDYWIFLLTCCETDMLVDLQRWM